MNKKYDKTIKLHSPIEAFLLKPHSHYLTVLEIAFWIKS